MPGVAKRGGGKFVSWASPGRRPHPRAARFGTLIGRALFYLALSAGGVGVALAAPLRIGAQKTGTFAWELAVVRAERLDEKAGLELAVTDLASTEAGKIALLGGSVDLILSDWLWAVRERGLGVGLVFYPYSSAVGALMIPPGATASRIEDLRGKSIGVAGGPIDKSWLLLQALAKRGGFDLKSEARIVFGAPPLLYEKARSGELDASLTFWNYAAALEARGFRRLVGMDDVQRRLGAKGPLALVGYVFDETLARTRAGDLEKFFAVTQEARSRLAGSDAAWERIGKEIGVADPKELALYRQRYVAGLAIRSIDEEAADAATLYAVLREIGGADLVGGAATLDPRVFYRRPAAPAAGAR